MLLKLEHIYKDYVQDKLTVPVLKDICFQVERGEYVASWDLRVQKKRL